MIDTAGPWGSGPFVLAEGYSSLENEIAIVNGDPFVCVWLPTATPRSERTVLEAYEDHWNRERGPRLRRIEFRNDLAAADALELVCSKEGEVDLVSEVAPSDVQKVVHSDHAQLAVVDAMRVLTGVINWGAEDVPLRDVRARRALNLAIDRTRLIREGFAGYAYPLAGLTPPYAGGLPRDQRPYEHDPDEAKHQLAAAGWPRGRPLRLAAPAAFEGVARLLEADFQASLAIDVETVIIPDDELLAAQHVLVEKVLPLPFDVLVHAWFDLASDLPPAVLHREFYHSTGAFRAGPAIEEVERLFSRFVQRTDMEDLTEIATEIDRYVHQQALSIFLCAPQALYAVNNHVKFQGYATTLELADTEVDSEHWSRR